MKRVRLRAPDYGCEASMDTDGWLIGEHIYIQEPTSEHNGWGIFLYPWGR
jgi:hypothetical protein